MPNNLQFHARTISIYIIKNWCAYNIYTYLTHAQQQQHFIYANIYIYIYMYGIKSNKIKRRRTKLNHHVGSVNSCTKKISNTSFLIVLFQFLWHFIIYFHCWYELIEFAACFRWKVASVPSSLHLSLSVAMQPNARVSCCFSFLPINAY